jgi:glycine betaine/proline transport system substrate-binding protein
MKLVHVDLPPFKEGCATEGPDVKCDYPPYELNKLIAKKFEDSGSPAVDLVKNFNWTNDDQNIVSTYIARDKMSPDEAAKKWVEDNPDKVKAWLE